MKKSLLALALGFSFVGAASADAFLFNPLGTGVNANARPVIKLNLDANPAVNSIAVNLGADNKTSNGDTFTENFVLDLTQVVRPTLPLPTTSTAGLTFTGATSGELEYRIYAEVSLNGFINNYVQIGAAGTVANPLAFANDIYDIVFAGGTINFFRDMDSDRTTLGDRVGIATLSVLSGGADGVDFSNSTATFDFGVNAAFTSADAGTWMNLDGTPLGAHIPFLFGIADASVNPVGFRGAGNTIFVDVLDNGVGAIVSKVPEPASLALAGLGLLGLGLTRRRKVVAN